MQTQAEWLILQATDSKEMNSKEAVRVGPQVF